MKNLALCALIVLAVFFITPVVSALEPGNFTVQFDSDDDYAHYNESYHIADKKYTPWWVWIFFVALGLGCLLGSFILSPSQRNDFFGYIAPLPLLISALMCTGLSGLDVVTGFGTTGVVETVQPDGVPQSHEFVTMTQHMVYVNDILAVFLLIMFLVAVVNCFRVYTDYQIFKGGKVDDE